jgi:hypothetical protein
MKIFLKIVSKLSLGVFVALLFLLVIYPEQTLFYFWNLVVPIVPIVLFISVGLWRNICPLAYISQIPYLNNFSFNFKMSENILNKGFYISLGVLLFAITARKFWFNEDAYLLFYLLILLAVLSFIFGLLFVGKSGWCNSLCPISSVEKFYGKDCFYTITQCDVREKSEQCIGCSKKCIDLKKDNLSLKYILKQKDHIFAAVFPGFVLGYFLVENYPVNPIPMIFLEMFFYSLGSSILYILFYSLKVHPKILILFAATGAINIYYIFALEPMIKIIMYGISLEYQVGVYLLLLVLLWLISYFKIRNSYILYMKNHERAFRIVGA